MDPGESVVEALIRECFEETGVKVINPQPRCVLPYISGRHQGFNFVFDCPDFVGEPATAEPELFDQSAWFALRALPDRCPPWLTDVLNLEATGEWFRELRWD